MQKKGYRVTDSVSYDDKADDGLSVKYNQDNTRDRILMVATKLFAEMGFDAVSTRQITSAAKANLGGVNYHFGSKENLIREVFRSLAEPMNEIRLTALDRYEAQVKPGHPPNLEMVARCLVEPTVWLASNSKSKGYQLTRLLTLARALSRPYIDEILAEQFDVIFRRFVTAFSRALPEVGYEQICWRYDFAIGAILRAVEYHSGSSRIKRVTEGRCDPSDVTGTIDELVAFVVAGMKGGALESDRIFQDGKLDTVLGK